MAQSRLSHEEFFSRLQSLLHDCSSKGHGSVFLVQKQLRYNTTDTHDTLPIIIRATDGKSRTGEAMQRTKNPDKVKLSTEVLPDQLNSFYARYADVCKAGMQALKKRDRSKRKKVKKAKKPA